MANLSHRKQTYAVAVGLARAGLQVEQAKALLGVGYVPLPGAQRDFHVAARLADYPGMPRFILIEGNRGGGKTQAAMMQVLADDCQRVPGLHVLFLRRISLALREQMEARQDTFLPSGTIPFRWRHSAGSITFPNGSTVRLGHFNQERDVDRYLGQEYDLILIEELTQLTQWKFSDIVSCLRSGKAGWRARLYATTNPDGVGFPWVKRLWIQRHFKENEEPGDFLAIHSDLAENTHINQEEYKRGLGLLTGSRRKAWLEGSWDLSMGTFFTNLEPEKVMEPASEAWRWSGNEIPRHWQLWGAYDYGWTHPCAWLSFGLDTTDRVHVIREWGEPRQTILQQAATIAAWPEARAWRYLTCGSDIWGSYDDSGRTIAEKLQEALREQGIHAPLRPAPMDRQQGWAEVNARIGDDEHPGSLRISEACPRTMEQLTYLEHDPNRPEDCLKVNADEEGEGGDDFVDALRYGLMSRVGESHIIRPDHPGYSVLGSAAKRKDSPESRRARAYAGTRRVN